jgi:GTP-binding protein LepA
LANVYLALENNLEIIPILNKIDLPAADPDRVTEEIKETIGLDCDNIVRASAKSGIGINDILESIVKYVPPPKPDTGGPFRALIFDSLFDAYRGVIVFMRIVDGSVKKGDKVRFLASIVRPSMILPKWGLCNQIKYQYNDYGLGRWDTYVHLYVMC